MQADEQARRVQASGVPDVRRLEAAEVEKVNQEKVRLEKLVFQ